jgi:hypothetical protein
MIKNEKSAVLKLFKYNKSRLHLDPNPHSKYESRFNEDSSVSASP